MGFLLRICWSIEAGQHSIKRKTTPRQACLPEGGDAEIDFVAEKPSDRLYIQVTESMLPPETRERELKSLRMIPDNYEKIVLSMDRNYISSYDGIKSLYLIDWLLA